MKQMTKGNLDQVIKSQDKIAVYFYEPGSMLCDIAYSSVEEIDSLVGKDFDIYTVDVAAEKEVADAFGVTSVPEIVIVKNTRIFARENKILYTNQILNLLK